MNTKLYGKAVKTIARKHIEFTFTTKHGFEAFVAAHDGFVSKYVNGTGGPIIPTSPMTWAIGNGIESIQYWKY